MALCIAKIFTTELNTVRRVVPQHRHRIVTSLHPMYTIKNRRNVGQVKYCATEPRVKGSSL